MTTKIIRTYVLLTGRCSTCADGCAVLTENTTMFCQRMPVRSHPVGIHLSSYVTILERGELPARYRFTNRIKYLWSRNIP